MNVLSSVKCLRVVESLIQSYVLSQHYGMNQLFVRICYFKAAKYQIHAPIAVHFSAASQENCDLLNSENGTKGNFKSSLSSLDYENEKEDCVIPGLEKYSLGNFHIKSFPPTFNFAAYVNDSTTLQELVKIGVSLHKWEKRKGIANFILQLDFNRHMSPYVRFLHDVGIPAEKLGEYLTINPLIFKENIDDLNVRINYLLSKNFSHDMIKRILLINPFWLMFRTKRIDRRLGHFQKTFHLSGNDVRQLTVKQPNLITYNMHHIKTNTFVLKEELGLLEKELKYLLLQKPKLWMICQLTLKERFEYVHTEMKIPHQLIVKSPEILGSRMFRIRERHLFLKYLKRDVYDPLKEGYVSLKSLASGSNAQFAVNIAKTSAATFNMFLKTL